MKYADIVKTGFQIRTRDLNQSANQPAYISI